MSKEQKPVSHLNRQLLDLVDRVNQAADLQGALAVCVERLSQLVPCDGISVMWLKGDHLEILGSSGPTAPLTGLMLPVGQMGAARMVLDGARVIVVPDVEQDARWEPVPGEKKVRTWLGAPLQVDHRTIGMLEWTARQPSCFGADAVEAAGEAARLIAPILHRMQLLEETRLRLRELIEPHMPSVPQAIDLAAELQPLVREARDFARARDAFVFLLSEGNTRLRCVAASGDQRDRLMRISLRGDGTLGGWKVPFLRSGNGLPAGPSDREVMASAGITNTLILPLRVAGEQLGMLGVAGAQRGGTFDTDAIRLMTHLASQASLIVERVHQVKACLDRFDYEMVVQSSPLGVGVLTLTGDIRICNPALAALLARSDRGLVGRNLADFLVPSDGRRLFHAMEEVSITGQRRQVDARIRTAQADERHIRISLALPHVSDDAVGHLVAMMEDITALKILEKERVEHLRELREKHALLEELDLVKSRFVSNVSHELRTPLAVIKLYATLARKGRPEKQTYYLQTIEQETHRLETMVENILDLTRMDRHTLRVQPEVLDAQEIIEQVLEVYQESAKKRGVELRNQLEGHLPPLWADKNHLIQMLTNLVDNALKYTPRDGQAWVAARQVQDGAQPMLEIAVGDTGVGISEDEQDRVFERFYRGSNNTPGSTGTGLGLAIVQELMIQHGGKVTLESKPGEGSTFALMFPLQNGEEPTRARVGAPEAVEEQAECPTSS